MIRILALLPIMFLISVCDELDTDALENEIANAEDCEMAGGEWAVGPESGGICLMSSHTDAGQSCTDSSECQGFCLADGSRGYCQDRPEFGCFDVLEFGDVQTVCVE